MAIYINGQKLNNIYRNHQPIDIVRVGKTQDRLVEGEDFIRGEWLKGDGSAYLKVTGFVRNENWIITTKIKDIHQSNTYRLLYGVDDNENNYVKGWTAFSNKDATFIALRRGNGSTYNDTARANIQSINTIVDSHNTVTINGTSFTMTGRQYVNDSEFRIFSQNRGSTTTSVVACDFSEFLVKESNVSILDLIPVILLRSIPSSLDGNSTARSAGECGMYDSVSGKFYGNIASSGSFGIEGIDLSDVIYKQYDWLYGDNTAYINGISYDLWNNHFVTKIGKTDQYPAWYFTHDDATNNIYFKSVVSRHENNVKYLMTIVRETSNAVHIADIDPYDSMPDEVTLDFYIENSLNYCRMDGTVLTNTGSPTCTQSKWTSIGPGIYSAKISYIREIKPDGSFKSELVPCRLLRSIPASLDGNGIARTAGTCGMWDKVNNKFYGNRNANGVFKVANGTDEPKVYREYKWLKGDGSAYIDTNFIVNVPTLNINLRFTKNTSSKNEPLFGSRDAISGLGSHIFYLIDQSLRLDVISGSTFISTTRIADVNDLTIDAANIKATLNGTIINGNATSSDLVNENSSNTFRIFSVEILNQVGAGNSPFSGSISYFTLNDGTHSLDLIPCKLLQDIPASLDANNVARYRGECGMWDRVNGKFYGNANSSGKFTVVNDYENLYEEYKWLKAEMPIGVGTMTELPINSSTMKYEVIHDGATANLGHFYTNGYSYYTNSTNMNRFSIWDTSGSTAVFDIYVNSNHMTIDSTDSYLEVNGVSITKYGYPITKKWIKSSANSQNAATTLTSSIYVDNILRYVPCKLLFGIPASLDANNIARPAGTCGFWDKKNNKFYGNIASSGRFSVTNEGGVKVYEEFKWLKTADGGGTPKIVLNSNVYNTDENAYIETKFKCAHLNGGVDMAVGAFGIGNQNNVGIRIFNANNRTYIDVHRFTNGVQSSKRIMIVRSDITKEIYLYVSITHYVVDDQSGDIVLGDAFDTSISQLETTLYTNNYNNNVWYQRTKVRSNNVEYDLIPCQLITSIPSYMDANNTARSAGECGMWDRVSNKFYGNASSSGKFTVSN